MPTQPATHPRRTILSTPHQLAPYSSALPAASVTCTCVGACAFGGGACVRVGHATTPVSCCLFTTRNLQSKNIDPSNKPAPRARGGCESACNPTQRQGPIFRRSEPESSRFKKLSQTHSARPALLLMQLQGDHMSKNFSTHNKSISDMQTDIQFKK